ncbi:porin [Inhella crocodyli]|nr:porin [Inhella crocodyli]
MKKTVVALAALLGSVGAMAQSSVTVFGVIDVAARDLKGANSVKQLVNEGRAASRLGFRGVEDIGGGLKASFHIEAGLAPDTGSADAAFWQRRSTVSLSGDFGEVRLGRQKAATRTLIDEFDVFGGNAMSGINRIIFLDRNRMDNQVAYYLPKLGDFYGNVEVTAGEGNTTTSGKSTVGRAGYKTKQLHLSAAYGQFGALNKLKLSALGASYDFGDFQLLSSYSQYKQGTASLKVTNLGATVKVGSGKVLASYGRATGASNREANLLAVGYDYSLSKRTTLYTTFGSIDNKGTSTFALAGAAGASLPTAGGKSRGYEFGVRHNF